MNLLADGTGIKFLGDGEWQARKHGVQGRRQWRKVHPAMDTAKSDIRAVEFTSSREGDGIRTNGRLWREECPAAVARNAILRDVREEGRAA